MLCWRDVVRVSLFVVVSLDLTGLVVVAGLAVVVVVVVVVVVLSDFVGGCPVLSLFVSLVLSLVATSALDVALVISAGLVVALVDDAAAFMLAHALVIHGSVLQRGLIEANASAPVVAWRNRRRRQQRRHSDAAMRGGVRAHIHGARLRVVVLEA